MVQNQLHVKRVEKHIELHSLRESHAEAIFMKRDKSLRTGH